MLALFVAVHEKETEMHVAARQKNSEAQLFARRERSVLFSKQQFNSRTPGLWTVLCRECSNHETTNRTGVIPDGS